MKRPWDLTWEETVRRHGLRPQREEFTVEQMQPWYHGWQPLGFTAETRWEETVTAEDAVQQVMACLGRHAPVECGAGPAPLPSGLD